MSLRCTPRVAMHTVHLDFAECEKKGEGRPKTKAFIVAIDRYTRYAVARAGGENADAVIQLLQQQIFKETKCVITDQARVFESKKLHEWAANHGMVILPGSPYNPKSNGLAERVIRDIKTFMSMYPVFRNDWKACLEAAVSHHNRSFCRTIGCSPWFALKGEPPQLSADRLLNITGKIHLEEQRFSEDQERRHREQQKKDHDRGKPQRIQALKVGDQVLVRRGLGKQFRKYVGPFKVVNVESFDGTVKRVVVQDNGLKKVAVRNVILYSPRRDSSLGGESSGENQIAQCE